MTDFRSELDAFLSFHQTVQKALDRYCDEYVTYDTAHPRWRDKVEYWHSFNIETYDDGRVVAAVYWEEDSHCSCYADESGWIEIPLDDLMPYLENQWEFDKFDQKLKQQGDCDDN